MVRRSVYDPFSRELRRWPHTIRAIDKYGFKIYERLIPAGADMRAEFEQELLKWAADGWTLEVVYKASCFMHRGTDRYCLSLAPDMSVAPIPMTW